MSNIVNVTEATFEEEVVKSAIPVLVDFWAPWCGPCKMIAPVLDDLSSVYEGRLKICKVNIDDNKEIVSQFSLRGVPTLIVFKDGKPENIKVGALTRPQLISFIDSSL